jgi:hypothetical protein
MVFHHGAGEAEATPEGPVKYSTLAGVADFEFPRLRVIVSTELAEYKRVPLYNRVLRVQSLRGLIAVAVRDKTALCVGTVGRLKFSALAACGAFEFPRLRVNIPCTRGSPGFCGLLCGLWLCHLLGFFLTLVWRFGAPVRDINGFMCWHGLARVLVSGSYFRRPAPVKPCKGR